MEKQQPSLGQAAPPYQHQFCLGHHALQQVQTDETALDKPTLSAMREVKMKKNVFDCLQICLDRYPNVFILTAKEGMEDNR